MENKGKVRNKFGIEIQGIELPEEIKKRIASEFQEVVLRNIASLDLRKDAGSGSNGPLKRILEEDYYYKPVFYNEWIGFLLKYLKDFQKDQVDTLPGEVQRDIEMFTN